MSTATAERRVRVTLEGTARRVSSGSSTSGREVVRLEYAPDTSVLLFTDAVTVEDVAPERTWTAGDVVAGDAAVYQRGADGKWRGVTETGLAITWTDEQVTAALGPDGLDVLRYQAGGDA